MSSTYHDKGTDRLISAIGAEPMTDDQHAEQEARKLRKEFGGSVKISRSTFAGEYTDAVKREWWIWLSGSKATCTASGATLSLAVSRVRREYELAMMVEQMRADVAAAEAAAPMPLPGLRHSDNQPLGSPIRATAADVRKTVDAVGQPIVDRADAIAGSILAITSGPTNDATTDTLPLVKTGPGGDFTQEYHG